MWWPKPLRGVMLMCHWDGLAYADRLLGCSVLCSFCVRFVSVEYTIFTLFLFLHFFYRVCFHVVAFTFWKSLFSAYVNDGLNPSEGRFTDRLLSSLQAFLIFLEFWEFYFFSFWGVEGWLILLGDYRNLLRKQLNWCAQVLSAAGLAGSSGPKWLPSLL